MFVRVFRTKQLNCFCNSGKNLYDLGKCSSDAKSQGDKIRAPQSPDGLELELEQSQSKGDGARGSSIKHMEVWV